METQRRHSEPPRGQAGIRRDTPMYTFDDRGAEFSIRQIVNPAEWGTIVRTSRRHRIPRLFAKQQGVDRAGNKLFNSYTTRETRGWIRLGISVASVISVALFVGNTFSDEQEITLPPGMPTLPPNASTTSPEPGIILDDMIAGSGSTSVFIDPITSTPIELGGSPAGPNDFFLTPEQIAEASEVTIPPTVTTTTTVPASTATTVPGDAVVVLRQGDSGEAVLSMQQNLVAIGCDIGEDGPDGRFGPDTFSGVTTFQTNANRVADGLYGPDTQDAMSFALSVGSAACGADVAWPA